jgi:hypothetical protein
MTSDVRIVISGVPNDESDDVTDSPTVAPAATTTTSTLPDPELLIENIKKQQKRRSSWCPEKERRKEEKVEKQRMMLAVHGRRWVFSRHPQVPHLDPRPACLLRLPPTLV